MKATTSGRNTMATVFWDNTSVILVDLLDRGDTLPVECYSVTLERLRQANLLIKAGLLSQGDSKFHDNTNPYTAKLLS
jgi:hypothetical protein